MPKTVGTALVYGEMISFSSFFPFAIGEEVRDEGGAGFKRSFQALYIVGLPIIKPGKGTDIFNYFLLRNFISGMIGDANRLDKT